MNNTEFQYWNICSALGSWDVVHFFNLNLKAPWWNMHQASPLLKLLFGCFTKLCRLSLDSCARSRRYRCAQVCQISPQFIWAQPSRLTISAGSQLVSNLGGMFRQTEHIYTKQQQQRGRRMQQICLSETEQFLLCHHFYIFIILYYMSYMQTRQTTPK